MVINALSEVMILVGAVLLLAWVISRFFPPKGINGIYGYRTPRSMRTDESWAHAQKLSNRYMLGLALVFLTVGAAFLFVDLSGWSAMEIMGVTIGVLVVGFGVLIFQVEKSLRRKFPKDANKV